MESQETRPATEGSVSGGRDSQPKLGEVLVAAGVISQVQLLETLDLQKNERGRRRRLGEILIAGGVCTEGQITRALSGQMRLGYVDLPTMAIPHEVVHLITRSLAERHDVIPVGITPEGALLLAMADPTDVVARDDVRVVTGRPVRPVCARPSHVRTAIGRYYRFSMGEDRATANVPSSQFVEVITETTLDQIAGDEGERPERVVSEERERIEIQPVGPDDRGALMVPNEPGGESDAVDVVDVIFDDAVRAGASDIHIEPRATGVDVRFRVDGLLHEVLSLPKHLQAPLLSRVKVLASLDIAERRRPQDGRVNITMKGNTIDARVSTMPTLHGEKIVVRLLDTSKGLLSLEQLGLAGPDRIALTQAVSRTQGLILACGPTGSGKTSSLYAIIRQVHRPDTNIVTIEDPVEYQVSGINQVQVEERAGVTFARALRTILRQDPDIVMVGEIRDSETAEIAFQASLTGHLVLSTLHTNDAPSAITRLVDMGVEPYLIASALSLVIAQRLVRRVCPNCVKPAQDVSPAILSALSLQAEAGGKLVQGAGCPDCRFTGYAGRVGVFQVLPITDLVKEQIITQVSERTISHAAEVAGVRTLRQAGVQLVVDGVSTAEEVLRVLQTEQGKTLCPNCANEVRPDFVMCPFCQTDLAKSTCHSCGRELVAGWHVCPFCSAPVVVRYEEQLATPTLAEDREDDEPDDEPKRILIVEDDDDVRAVLELDLGGEGYRVFSASDGETAIREAALSRPHLVLLDVMLPDTSGITVCRQLRRLPQTSLVPVIFLTARSDMDTELQGFEAGADDYLVKPVNRERLLARIATRLRSSALTG